METPDLAERGRGGTLDARVFMQLLAFGGCRDMRPVVDAVRAGGVEGAVYADLHDPTGVAVLGVHEEPGWFVEQWRELLLGEPFASLTPKPRLTMFGRSYAIGYEPDLDEVLLRRPRRTALNPDTPWAVWYPLRRSGSFEQLDDEQRRAVLMEHGTIGRGFVEAGHAFDVRLACHGLDRHDNDFVIGLCTDKLHAASKLVETMRKTTQTSQHLASLGPFFVGRAVWQSAI